MVTSVKTAGKKKRLSRKSGCSPADPSTSTSAVIDSREVENSESPLSPELTNTPLIINAVKNKCSNVFADTTEIYLRASLKRGLR